MDFGDINSIDFLMYLENKCQELDDLAISSKCDYCNCALSDCSLCGVGGMILDDDDTPIC